MADYSSIPSLKVEGEEYKKWGGVRKERELLEMDECLMLFLQVQAKKIICDDHTRSVFCILENSDVLPLCITDSDSD